MTLAAQLGRLAKHSAVYGLGALVQRFLGLLLLPVYTRYLSPSDYGMVEVLLALTVAAVAFLRLGVASAFFRFYFDSSETAHRLLVVRTSFWFTMAMATLGLLAGVGLSGQISSVLFDSADDAELVAAAFVGLWTQMNFEQLAAVFRVEERSVAFVSASLASVATSIAATLILVVWLDQGPLGVIVGGFTGTLLVYLVLLAYRREQLGFQLSLPLLREMNRFGIPFVPAAFFLWAVNFSDRLFLVELSGTDEVGLYSVGVRIASVAMLLVTAFRLGWPAFAYAIEDEGEARTTYAFVLTYVVLLMSWLAVALTLLSPWLVDTIAAPAFGESSRVVGPLAFGAIGFAGYVVVVIGVGRIRRTQFNWVVTGIAAAVNVALNLILIPRYGMMGAGVATLVSFTTMFAVMAWWAQRVYPVPYQWRRVLTAALAAAALVSAAKWLDVSLPLAVLAVLVYPAVLLPLRFYLPDERRAIGSRLRPARS
jgi:O-antigen/teichoic acid export membrane protein